ncbi:unnamed protein product [Rhizoctonia solani]|uniref:HNH nuclease domain-containing protein n=1 Tax=Rhizoctonia solani TaxID=456999 RepID=A0A8H2ZWL9_9AGAM|nr:unnamed protein product [Rhizoctonia solani]
MSIPTTLPPIVNLFEGDEATRSAYSRLLGAKQELPIRILGQMLIQAPSAAGRTYVAKSINRCTTLQEITELGYVYFSQFVKYFKMLRTPAGASSYSSLDDVWPDSSFSAPTSHLEAKKQALVRDNYRCMLSSAVDGGAVEALPALRAEVINTRASVKVTGCYHIIPQCNGNTGTGESNCRATNVWPMAHLFGDIPENSLKGDRTYGLGNALTLERGIGCCFANLQIWLEPTGMAKHQYFIKRREEYNCRELPAVVTFSSTLSDLELPDPQYLALHAAVSRVIKFTDAVGIIERVIDDEEEIKVLSEDGSSGQLLNHILFAEALTAC